MEIQSIFARKSLPEAGFGKNVVIDAHRCSGSGIHLDHRSAGQSIIQDHSSDHRFKRLDLTRASVRRASGFVLTGKQEGTDFLFADDPFLTGPTTFPLWTLCSEPLQRQFDLFKMVLVM
jgi:hypothetical protein